MLRARAARPTTKPDTRLKSQSPSSPCVRGAPRMVPVFGGERFLRPSRGLHKGLWPAISRFLAVHKTCPQFSGSYPPVGPDSPQEVHKPGPASCWASPLSRAAPHKTWQAQFETGRTQQETSTIREGPGTIKGRAPPRMRWRGPPDLAAQTPLTHAQRPCHSTSHQAGYPLEVPVARFPLRPGCPPVVPVFGGERFLRLFRAAAQGVSAGKFKIF